MKILRATAAVAFFAAICVGSASAQQPRAGATSPATGPALAVNIPDSKIALVNSDEFTDEKTGIVRLVNAAKKVDGEFAAKRKELQDLDAAIKKAEADLAKVQAMQTPLVNQQQQDKIDQMKKDLQRKGEDAQAAYQKRLQEVLGPVYDEIGKALDVYAKARGITLILDVTKVQGIVSAADSLDITKAFITEFNSKNPATVASTQP
jgi:Skp family chaperone for outer membrane proteins